jgi:adenine/guanine phosphoribosyltransferase-like PRPP-binding protein
MPKEFATVLRVATRTLRAHKDEFDAIAFRGMSGAMVAPVLASRLNKSLILVRKEDEVCHSSHNVEGATHPQRVAVVDDFVATGETLTAIVRGVKELNSHNKIVGFFMWHPERRYDESRPWFTSTRSVDGISFPVWKSV